MSIDRSDSPARSCLAPCDVPRESPAHPGYCRCGHFMDEHADRPREERIGAELPGSLLVLTADTGGERWTLDGRPLSAGVVVDVLTEGRRESCQMCSMYFGSERCDEYDASTCTVCGGLGYTAEVAWLAVRFESRPGVALPYLPIFGAGEAHHALQVRPGDAVRCRWPAVRS